MLFLQSLGMIFAVVVQVASFVGALAIPILMTAELADIRSNLRDRGTSTGKLSSLWRLLAPVTLPFLMYPMMLLANTTGRVEQRPEDVYLYMSIAVVFGLLLVIVYFVYREHIIRIDGSSLSATLTLRRALWRATWRHPLQYRKAQKSLRTQQEIRDQRVTSLVKDSPQG